MTIIKMFKAPLNLIAVFLLVGLIFLGLISFLHESGMGTFCAFSFLFNSDCRAARNPLAFIASHIAGFKQLSQASSGADVYIILLLTLLFFAALFLFSGKAFLRTIQISLRDLYFFRAQKNLVFNFLIAWLAVREIKDPSILNS